MVLLSFTILLTILSSVIKPDIILSFILFCVVALLFSYSLGTLQYIISIQYNEIHNNDI
jgi:hypothetical protein